MDEQKQQKIEQALKKIQESPTMGQSTMPIQKATYLEYIG